jgi:hypothetical protein
MRKEEVLRRGPMEDLFTHFEFFTLKWGRIPPPGCPRCPLMYCPQDCTGWRREVQGDIMEIYEEVRDRTQSRESRFQSFKEKGNEEGM